MNCKNVKWGQKIKGIVKLMETPYQNKISSSDEMCKENKAKRKHCNNKNDNVS